MREAVICEPVRTAVGGFGGALRDVPAHELAATVIRAVVCACSQSRVTPSATSTSTSPPSRTWNVAASVTTTSTGRCAVSG